MIETIGTELVPFVPESTAQGEMLEKVYQGLPAHIVKECESRRFCITYAPVAHLIVVRDLLTPYYKFAEWCRYAHVNYNATLTAIRQYELHLLEKGETETPTGVMIKPMSDSELLRAMSRGRVFKAHHAMRNVLSDKMYEFVTQEWLIKYMTTKATPEIRERAKELGTKLIIAAYEAVNTVESDAEETANGEVR